MKSIFKISGVILVVLSIILIHSCKKDIPATVPGAPTGATATAGDIHAIIIFTAPVSNGGSTITGYTVTSNPGNISSTGSASPITVTGLTNGIAYTFTVTATNAIGTSEASSASNSVIPTLSDPDGNIYTTMTIGTQVWMKENLKTTKYNDGTAIPNVTVNATWSTLTTGAYRDYSNTAANSLTYGRQYNWYAVDNNVATRAASNGGKNVCPTGYHVPSDAEWTTLINLLGGESIAGSMLKETGTTHWLSPNTGATNNTGFTALPGGYCDPEGGHYFITINGFYWSSTEYSTGEAFSRIMSYNYYYAVKGSYNKRYGYSIRCIRD
jgi:uncharacterized protein (TIGR02145 family)